MRSLIDGDIVVYRCGFAAEHTRYIIEDEDGRPFAGPFDNAAERDAWITEEYQESGFLPDDCFIKTYKDYEPLSHALANAKSVIAHLYETIGKGHIFLSQGRCFRHKKIATMLEYKGNRKDAAKPKHYDAIRKFLVENYGAITFSSIEADDALAIAQTEDTVICSIDKDLLQVPGLHYNWVHARDENNESSGKAMISKEVGDAKLWQQVLTGDGTDNIPGIYRCGPVTARKHIATCSNPTEMMNLTSELWAEYLASGKKMPCDGMTYEDGRVTYTHWSGARDMSCDTDAVRNEVLRLVKVGGNDAKTAAHESGEDVLIPAAA